MQSVITMRDARAPDTVLAAPPPKEATTRAVAANAARPRGAFAPMLLCSLAVLAWLAFQAWQLDAERQALQAARVALQPTLDNAAKLRSSLDALAADTQRLADSGNPNAKVLVEELRKRGITINAAGGANATPAR